MNCENYKNIIPEYVSGELDENKISDLEKHIDNCSDCKYFLEKEKSILSYISEDNYEIPSGLNRTVLSKLPVKKNIFHANFMRYAIAASFFFMIIVSYFVFNPAIDNGDVNIAEVKIEKNVNSQTNYYSGYIIGSDYDDLISYKTELYDENKWTSENTDIFQSEDDLINDLLTLEELESYDDYLTSL